MNDIVLPRVGYGTWKLPMSEETSIAVLDALDLGYRHIDTAAAYANESYIRDGIKKSSILREDIYVSGKLWNSKRTYEKAIKACKRTIKNLGLDYLDMYLIHWVETPEDSENWEENNLDTWRALEHLKKEGLVKSIGVSNCDYEQLASLIRFSNVKPALNQIEFHCGCNQDEIINYCNKKNIKVEGWSPLGNGNLLNNPIIKDVSVKYNKSPAQICIRWCLQHNVTPITKSINQIRMQENLNVYDFNLDEKDMILLNNIHESRVEITL